MERTNFIASLVLTTALGIGLHAETRAESPGYAEAQEPDADRLPADVPANADATTVLASPESDNPEETAGGDATHRGPRNVYTPAFERRDGAPEVNGSADAAESLYRLGLRIATPGA